MVDVKRAWRLVAIGGLIAGVLLLAVGALLAVSLGTPAQPNPWGVALAALGFISTFAGGLSLANIVFFRVLRRMEDAE